MLFFTCFHAISQSSKTVYSDIRMALEEKSKVKVLRLDGQNLERLPPEINQLKKLQVITLQGNPRLDITHTFKTLSKLKRLRSIDLSYCDIDSLPGDIGQLDNIKVLKIGANKLRKLPTEINELKRLKRIVFSQNSNDFMSWEIREVKDLLQQSPSYDIILEDYFGGVHGNFRMKKRRVKLTKNNFEDLFQNYGR